MSRRQIFRESVTLQCCSCTAASRIL